MQSQNPDLSPNHFSFHSWWQCCFSTREAKTLSLSRLLSPTSSIQFMSKFHQLYLQIIVRTLLLLSPFTMRNLVWGRAPYVWSELGLYILPSSLFLLHHRGTCQDHIDCLPSLLEPRVNFCDITSLTVLVHSAPAMFILKPTKFALTSEPLNMAFSLTQVSSPWILHGLLLRAFGFPSNIIFSVRISLITLFKPGFTILLPCFIFLHSTVHLDKLYILLVCLLSVFLTGM